MSVKSAGQRLYEKVRDESGGIGSPWDELRPAVRNSIERHAALLEKKDREAA